MKRNISNHEEPPRENAYQRSQKRLQSHKSDQSSRKRLSYKIDIPVEPIDTSPPFQRKVMEIYNGIPMTIILALITCYVLFADDVRQIAFPPSADLAFNILNIICIVIFLVEITILSVFKVLLSPIPQDQYFLRFYFWLDLISTITMIFDLTWISDLLDMGQAGSATNVIQITRAGRASKLGARTARFIRIIRLMRMLKLYKTASKTMDGNSGSSRGGGNDPEKRASARDPMGADLNQPNRTPYDFKTNMLVDCIKEDKVIDPETRDRVEQLDQHSVDKLETQHPEVRRNKFKLPPLMTKKLSKFDQDEADRVDKIERDVVVTPKPQQKRSSNYRPNDPPMAQSAQRVEDPSLKIPIETKVGTKLKDEIQKNIILMVLLVLISVPMFTSDTWIEQATVYNRGINQLQFFLDNPNYSQPLFDTQLSSFLDLGRGLASPIVFLNFPRNSSCCVFPTNFSNYTNVKKVSDIRSTSLAESNYKNITILFDTTDQDILTSKLNIGRTIFVCVLLVGFSLLFTRDVEEYALEPLENMITTVKRIAENPLQAIIAIENQNIIKSTIKDDDDDQQKKKTEPIILENMIVKIGALLAVGFGEAGSQIIAKNIENHGAVNAVLSGKKIMAIFGFCDIRNFTDATEVLQTKVMNFVNQIAAIVHGVVNRCAGSANKNIGDAFLLVWKFKEKQTIISQVDGETSLSLRKISKVRQTADLAVYSFVKIIAEITKSHVLEKYKRNEKLKSRIKNYEGVRMGFGLHVGWAIEGGIGSQFKIDASYLSPNVNMSSRLEAATKQFGANILISGQLADLMTFKNKELLRRIDRVTVKGSNQPIDLYTVDLSIRHLADHVILRAKQDKKTQMERKKQKILANTVRQNLLEKLETSKRITENLFTNDQDFFYMREPYTTEFYTTWNTGIDAYIKGDWTLALRLFKMTHKMLPNIVDGPSETLIEVIQASRGETPQNWLGYRELTQK